VNSRRRREFAGPTRVRLDYDGGMTNDGAPKSRLELVMEKLRQQDEAKGITQVTLTDAQREEITAAKKQYEARIAQRRIMHQTAIGGTFDPAVVMEREEELRRDLARFEREHEETLARIRRGE
jgi:hypothetical protein